MLWHTNVLSRNFPYDFVSKNYRSISIVVTLRQFLKELCLFLNSEYRKYSVFVQFSAPLSYMFCHIEPKFCIWLCFNVLQIKFECCHFASNFEGAVSFWTYKEKCSLHSCPDFSPTRFDILSGKVVALDFVLIYYISSSSVVTLCLSISCTFLLYALTNWA